MVGNGSGLEMNNLDEILPSVSPSRIMKHKTNTYRNTRLCLIHTKQKAQSNKITVTDTNFK